MASGRACEGPTPRTDSGLRARWARTSLRAQLVVGLVAVLAVAFLIIGSATVIGLRSWLVARIDNQLVSARGSLVEQPMNRDPAHRMGSPMGMLNTSGALVVLIGPSGAVVLSGQTLDGSVEPRDVGAMLAVPVGDGTDPVTVDLPSLGEYRAIALPAANASRVVAAVPLESVNTVANSLAVVEVSVLGVTLVGLGVLGWWLIGLSLRPLTRVADTAAEVAALPLDRGEGQIPSRVHVAHPGTEVGQVGAAVNAMLDHVEDSLKSRRATEDKLRRFVSDAGHELRTPLAAVRGYSELIRRSDEEHPEQTPDSARRIELAATRMGLLVDDLLVLAAIDEGRPMRQDLVEIQLVVADSVAEAYPLATDVNWVVAMPEEAQVVVGDAHRLHQAVSNLLSNAVAHCPDDATVKVTLAQEAGSIRLVVHDNGPGFPPELLSTATERFTRGDESRSRSTGGAGLGLAIVRAIVEAHSGTVSLGNDHGAWVCLRLPAAPVRATGDAEANGAIRAADG